MSKDLGPSSGSKESPSESVVNSLSTIVGAEFRVAVDRVESIKPLSQRQKHYLQRACEEVGLGISTGESSCISVNEINNKNEAVIRLSEMADNEKSRITGLRIGKEFLRKNRDIVSGFSEDGKVLIIPSAVVKSGGVGSYLKKLTDLRIMQAKGSANGDIVISAVSVEGLKNPDIAETKNYNLDKGRY